MDHQIEEEVSEYNWNPVDHEANFDTNSIEDEEVQIKASRKLPEVWTRVMSIYGDNLALV